MLQAKGSGAVLDCFWSLSGTKQDEHGVHILCVTQAIKLQLEEKGKALSKAVAASKVNDLEWQLRQAQQTIQVSTAL